MNLNQLKINIQSRLLQPVEIGLRMFGVDPDLVTPVWIVGVPRSGTTLGYQLMCSSFNASYLTNRVAKRYRIAKTTRIWEKLVNGGQLKPASFQSNYGKTNIKDDPHEGGAFFYQYFPKSKLYCTVEDVNRPDEFKRLIGSITEPNKIFISKNTYHSLRIKALKELFPQSRYLWIYRNKADNIRSLFQACEKHGVGENGFWGLTPPGWERHKNDRLLDKVVWQVEETEKLIGKELQNTESIYCKVSYEELCNDPRQVIREVAAKFGILESLYCKELSNIPLKFNYSSDKGSNLIREIEDRLANG